jgi:hypothetical protein
MCFHALGSVLLLGALLVVAPAAAGEVILMRPLYIYYLTGESPHKSNRGRMKMTSPPHVGGAAPAEPGPAEDAGDRHGLRALRRHGPGPPGTVKRPQRFP